MTKIISPNSVIPETLTYAVGELQATLIQRARKSKRMVIPTGRSEYRACMRLVERELMTRQQYGSTRFGYTYAFTLTPVGAICWMVTP